MTQLDKTQRVFRPIFAYACFRIFHVSYPGRTGERRQLEHCAEHGGRSGWGTNHGVTAAYAPSASPTARGEPR